MTIGTLNKPARDTKDWHTPLNDNFRDIEDEFNFGARLYGPFACHEQDTPDMSVQVDAGYIWDASGLTEVGVQNTANLAAPSSNDRIDRVVLDESDGTISVVTGSEATSPTPPSVPDGKLPCAQVLLTTTTTEITNSEITDERAMMPRNGWVGRDVEIDSDDNIFGYGMKVEEKTSDFTLGAAEKGKTIECNKASAFAVTVPSNSNVPLPVGYSVTIVQAGSGKVSVSGQAGVTIRTASSTSVFGQWSIAMLYKRNTDEWVIAGDLE